MTARWRGQPSLRPTADRPAARTADRRSSRGRASDEHRAARRDDQLRVAQGHRALGRPALHRVPLAALGQVGHADAAERRQRLLLCGWRGQLRPRAGASSSSRPPSARRPRPKPPGSRPPGLCCHTRGATSVVVRAQASALVSSIVSIFGAVLASNSSRSGRVSSPLRRGWSCHDCCRSFTRVNQVMSVVDLSRRLNSF